MTLNPNATHKPAVIHTMPNLSRTASSLIPTPCIQINWIFPTVPALSIIALRSYSSSTFH